MDHSGGLFMKCLVIACISEMLFRLSVGALQRPRTQDKQRLQEQPAGKTVEVFRQSGTTAWESQMFQNVCPHVCELSSAVPQHPPGDVVGTCCFPGVDVLLTFSADALSSR